MTDPINQYVKKMKIKPFPESEHVTPIAVPVPGLSNLITVNLYALGKGPITLIDTCLKAPGTLEFVGSALRERGLDLRDVERIIITHGHMDHFGLAAAIRQAVSHPVEYFIHGEDKWQISSANFGKEMWSEEANALMAMAGMPMEEKEKVRKRFAGFRELGDPLDEVSILKEGREFEGEGYHLKVIHTPGHTPGSCCIYECGQKILFSGDTVIKHITPNPFVVIRRNGLRDPGYKSLKAYSRSLDRLAGMDIKYVFTGHGEYIRDLPNLISTYKRHHRERMELVWKALHNRARTLYDIIEEVFSQVPEGETFLAISEILVHLEILLEEEQAELIDPGPPAIYHSL
jgi:glyoxylase-like metal-dependent hydrolase (beta-lactamase superfamily II)